MRQLAAWFEDYNEVHSHNACGCNHPGNTGERPPTPRWSGLNGPAPESKAQIELVERPIKTISVSLSHRHDRPSCPSSRPSSFAPAPSLPPGGLICCRQTE